MVEITSGNIVEADTQAVVNTVNCVGVMGKGIALQFKQAFPENFQDYKRACDANKVRPGRVHVHTTSLMEYPKYIINFPTKRHWKGKSKIEDIERGLEDLVLKVEQLKIESIAVPPLGCGNGGLVWNDVYARIEEAFAAVPSVRLVVYAPSGSPAPRNVIVATERPLMTLTRAIFVKLVEQYSRPGYGLSLLESQKLAYFLQEAGLSLRLIFVKLHFGPYAENLNHVLQRIEGHYVRGYGDRTGQAAIELLPDAVENADKFLADYDEPFECLNRVRRLIEGFENPYGMELLSSLHWVATHDAPSTTNAEEAFSRLRAWNERKRRLFKPEHMRIAWNRLYEQKWIQSGMHEPSEHSEDRISPSSTSRTIGTLPRPLP